MHTPYYGRRRWCRHHVFAGGTAPIAAILSLMPENYLAHDHDFLEIAMVVEGSGIHRTAQGRHVMREGDVFVLRPGAWHAFDNCRGLVLFNCCLGGELLQRELAWLSDDPVLNRLLWTGPMSPARKGVMAVRIGGTSFRTIKTHWRKLNRVCQGPADGVLGRVASLIGFLESLSRAAAVDVRRQFPAEPQAHPAVSVAMRAMQEDIQRNWTLEMLTEPTRIHPAYLIRLFKAHTGLPPIGYLARCRAERAAMLLSGTKDPIREVAEAVGWPDQNYFARRFRMILGLSPTEYRRRLSRVDPADLRMPVVPRQA
jgi:AraC family L-rhamnose operon transcriptional activator RhaR